LQHTGLEFVSPLISSHEATEIWGIKEFNASCMNEVIIIDES
jgi:hypothetical protein